MRRFYFKSSVALTLLAAGLLGAHTSALASDSLVSMSQPDAPRQIADARGNLSITYAGSSSSQNSLLLTQSGGANRAEQYGYGRDGSLTVFQAMQNNTAVQQQFGHGDTAVITQIGTGNVARQAQR